MVNPKRTKSYPLDGDTIKIQTSLNGSDKVRLSGVNAPELGSRAGNVARDKLARLLKGKPITIQTVARDVYGRNVGVVRVGGRNINNAMKRLGY